MSLQAAVTRVNFDTKFETTLSREALRSWKMNWVPVLIRINDARTPSQAFFESYCATHELFTKRINSRERSLIQILTNQKPHHKNQLQILQSLVVKSIYSSFYL